MNKRIGLLAVAVAVGLVSLSACNSPARAPASSEAPAAPDMAGEIESVDTPHTWGTMATLIQGAQVTVSQPVRKGTKVSYEMTVTNQIAKPLTYVGTANITADSLPIYFGNSDTDAGDRLTLMKDQTVKYTVTRTGVPATAKTLALVLSVSHTPLGDNLASDRPMWMGDIA